MIDGSAAASSSRAPNFVEFLLGLAESRAPVDTAEQRLRAEGIDTELEAFGPVGKGHFGYQLIAKRSEGYLRLKIFYEDFIEPLIVRKGQMAQDVAAQACCCMTMVQCGSLEDLSVEDPCPSGERFMDRSDASGGSSFRPYESERLMAMEIADLADSLAVDCDSWAGRVPDRIEQLKRSLPHRELLFTSEDDSDGGRFEFVLKFSTGAVLTACAAIGADKIEFLPVEGVDVVDALSIRVSLAQTDADDALLTARMARNC